MTPPYAKLLHQLPQETRACLRLLCLGQACRISELEAIFRAGPVHPHLQKLLEHGLAFPIQGLWQASWAGRGVHNWDQQVFWAEAQGQTSPPEPQGFENGDFRVEGCPAYRALFARPGYCWCGRQRSEHADQAPEIAREYLISQRKQPRAQE